MQWNLYLWNGKDKMYHDPHILIQIRDLTWGYTDQHQLFDHFNFVIHQGDFCVLQGASGSGKTTLVKMLTGYIKPPRGHIFHHAEDLAKLSHSEMQLYRRSVGTMYQENKLLDHLNVRENVCYPLEIHGFARHVIEPKYNEIMKLVALEGKDTFLLHQLSGGEKQKVAIARALIHSPECVITDEATGNLDAQASQGIATIMIKANQLGTTVLFITHDNQLVEYIRQQHPIIYHQL